MKRHNYRFYVYKHISTVIFIAATGILALSSWRGIERGWMMKYQEKETRNFVKQLGPGLNWGNTLDTHDLHLETKNPSDFETYWGNPVTTREMIKDIKQTGFDVLRIPVTWQEHMDENDHIEKAWLNRVAQVVDYGLEAGMYVIINAHHDSWYMPDDVHLPTAVEKTRHLWSQLAQRFQAYDQRLLFEGMNEPRLIGEIEEWSGGTPRSREIVNILNAVFVRTIRESGGENNDRYLILSTYCAKTYREVLQDFQFPEGSRLILSVHFYSPYDFSLNIQGPPGFDPKDPLDTKEMDQMFEDLDRFFISKGMPVIITEFGAVDKQNERQRTAWARYVRGKAKKLGIACIWWDAGSGEKTGRPFPLYDRYTRQWLFPDLTEALTE